jgi:hypothetical protein
MRLQMGLFTNQFIDYLINSEQRRAIEQLIACIDSKSSRRPIKN